MSIQAICWVLDHSEATGIDRLVLLAIANHASNVGHEAFPSLDTIAREARCSRATVKRSLRSLVDAGELAYVRSGAPTGGARRIAENYRPNLYWMPHVPGCPGHEPDCGQVVVTAAGGSDVTPLGGPVENTTGGSDVTPLGGSSTHGRGLSVEPSRGLTVEPQNVPSTVLNRPLSRPADNEPPAATGPRETSEPDHVIAAAINVLAEWDLEHAPRQPMNDLAYLETCRQTRRRRHADDARRLLAAGRQLSAEDLAAELDARLRHPAGSAGPPPAPPGPCVHCGHPARHHGRACWTRIADETIADELRAEDERDDEGEP